MAHFVLHKNINVRTGNALLGPTGNYKVQYFGYFPNMGSPKTGRKRVLSESPYVWALISITTVFLELH